MLLHFFSSLIHFSNCSYPLDVRRPGRDSACVIVQTKTHRRPHVTQNQRTYWRIFCIILTTERTTHSSQISVIQGYLVSQRDPYGALSVTSSADQEKSAPLGSVSLTCTHAQHMYYYYYYHHFTGYLYPWLSLSVYIQVLIFVISNYINIFQPKSVSISLLQELRLQ